MNKKYDPREIERDTYSRWENAGYFRPSGEGDPYCILIPPPNITGSLHMGHAFQHTLIDTLIRYFRMQKQDVLWQVGTDHAGIATQMLVERQLEADGVKRQDLGRAAFTDKIWKWYDKSGSEICSQLRRMGSSVDWSKEQFTMHPNYSHAVHTAFIELYDDGLIYRGKRLVNWDPVLQTAISDLEVNNQEEQGQLWYLRYPLVGTTKTGDQKDHLVVATTRPETMFGDVAVAVHPEDARYKHLVGQQVQLPVVGRALPVIADNYVDPEFGTGCLKITPAHDFNDYEVGKRHDLPTISVLDSQARMNSDAPEAYQGLDRFEARKQLTQALQDAGLVEQTKAHKLMIPRGDRSGAVIEPRLTDQWFVDMKSLVGPAIKVVQEGRIQFVPKSYENLYFSWLREVQDWCISRQQWWGHRIPAWYDESGKIYVGPDEPEVRKKYDLADEISLQQETDVLETWFSSGLWSFASLGWPESAETLDRYHPTSVLVTGHDIIFFWVARMIMLSLRLKQEVPFREVYVHGLVRDAEGQKMSKSKGNGLDPLDLIDGISLDELVAKRTANLMQPQMVQRIEKNTRRDFPQGIPAFGTDALRFTFCAMASGGRDIPFDMQRIAGYQHFCNKLWNAGNFVFSHTEGKDCGYHDEGALELNLVDHWILQCLQKHLRETREAIRTYRFDLMARSLYEFAWHEYCDWYLELVKPVLLNPDTEPEQLRGVRHRLLMVLEALLRSLHPVIPFITETLWQRCAGLMALSGDTVMLQRYPEATDYDQQVSTVTSAEEIMANMDWLKKMTVSIRTLRAELNISPGREVDIILQGSTAQDSKLIGQTETYLKKLAKIRSITSISADATPPTAAVQMVGNLKVLMPLKDLVDKDKEIARLKKEINKRNTELNQVGSQLGNQNFRAKAPAEVIAKKEQRRDELKVTIEKLNLQIEELSSM